MEEKDRKVLEKLQAETSVVAVREIANVFAEEIQDYPFSVDVTREEILEKIDTMQDKVISVLVEKKVALKDFDMVFESLISILSTVSAKIKDQIESIEKEYMARIIQAKNPTNDKFDYDFADFGNILSTLIKLREDTGGIETYFNIGESDETVQDVQKKDKEA